MHFARVANQSETCHISYCVTTKSHIIHGHTWTSSHLFFTHKHRVPLVSQIYCKYHTPSMLPRNACVCRISCASCTSTFNVNNQYKILRQMCE